MGLAESCVETIAVSSPWGSPNPVWRLRLRLEGYGVGLEHGGTGGAGLRRGGFLGFFGTAKEAPSGFCSLELRDPQLLCLFGYSGEVGDVRELHLGSSA